MSLPTFEELGLDDRIIKQVSKLGYERPWAIQAKAIPPALAGKDIVGLSETGSGKTAAFTLPALQLIDQKNRSPQVLILCPTRELCVQVCEEVYRLGAGFKDLHALPVYGGAAMDRQIRALRQGVHLVVGTPGRVIDHLKRGTLKTGSIKIFILDEADRMLDMGFREDMDLVIDRLPKDHQTLFFSATMNRQVESLIKRISNDPQTISIERKTLTVSTVEQEYFEVRNRSKIEVLSRLLDMTPPRLAIVFCNTKMMVDGCCESLLARGYTADRLHGDIAQNSRERILKRFREGSVELLVATDVAARGLDIDNVDIVFNYDLPHDPEDYVHRIGRTGRVGRSGKAISFIFGRDIYRLQMIERYTKQKIKRSTIPSQEDVEGKRSNVIFDKLRDRLETRKFENHEALVDRLLDQGYTPTDIASGLFTLLREGQSRETSEIAEDTQSHNSKPHGNEDRSHSSRGKNDRDRRGKKSGGRPFKGKSKGKKSGFNKKAESRS